MNENKFVNKPVELKSVYGISYVAVSALVIVATIVLTILALVNKSSVYCFVISLIGIAFVLFLTIMEFVRYRRMRKETI